VTGSAEAVRKANLLVGDRVRLTAIDENDMATIAGWYQDTHFLRLYDSAPAYPKTEKQIQERIKESQDDELNLHRLCLTVFSYNEAAIALYRQLGFRHEGTYREHLQRDGQRHDMHLYGILRREWEESRVTDESG